jgi:hypothetical protein
MEIKNILNTKENPTKLLENKELDINLIKEIYLNFKYDLDVISKIAMNLSMRTSVYDSEKEKSDVMIWLLVELSDSSDMSVRWAVAKNPHTPVEILEKLSNDEVNLVRALVATNPNTPIFILNKFFSDEKIVRDGLSGNPSTPTKILNILADDSDKMVRIRVAKNPLVSKETLLKLLNDFDLEIKKIAEIKLKEKYGKETND